MTLAEMTYSQLRSDSTLSSTGHSHIFLVCTGQHFVMVRILDQLGGALHKQAADLSVCWCKIKKWGTVSSNASYYLCGYETMEELNLQFLASKVLAKFLSHSHNELLLPQNCAIIQHNQTTINFRLDQPIILTIIA